MAKYRKKPVVIDAWPWPELPDDAPVRCYEGESVVQPYRQIVETLEGDMERSEGDWLIKGIKGEFYPCKPDIFEKTYEPVEESR